MFKGLISTEAMCIQMIQWNDEAHWLVGWLKRAEVLAGGFWQGDFTDGALAGLEMKGLFFPPEEER